MARIDELRAAGTSLLFASHNLEQVAEQCDEALWLEEGACVLGHGEADEVVERYRGATQEATLMITPAPDRDGWPTARRPTASSCTRPASAPRR